MSTIRSLTLMMRRGLGWLLLVPALAFAAPPDVLVICSYAPGYEWSDDMLKGMMDAVREKHPEFEPIIHFLDNRRFPDERREAWQLEDIVHKCRTRPPKLIVSLDNAAFDFVLKHRAALGADIPWVFGGLNRYLPEMIAGQRDVTGVSEETDFSGTFALIRALKPQARQVLVIGNQSASSLEKSRAFDELAPGEARGLVLEHYDNWTNAELLNRVRSLKDDWVGLILDVTTDATGANNYNDATFSEQLAAQARVPLFLTARPPGTKDWALHSWDGIGGGMVVADLHGAKVGELVLRVLAGEPAGSIPVVTRSPQSLEVDYRQMKHFGLSTDLLPAGTKVINQPKTYYQVNRSRVILVGVVVLLLCGVIVVLSFNILWRQRAERALREAEERLRTAQKLEAVGLLAGGVAHDFNNILQVISGHASFLKESVADRPEASQDVETISAAAGRAAQLTGQLLAFSRKQPLRVEMLDLGELVAAVVKMLRRILGEHIELQAELPDTPLFFSGDKVQIEQVLLNLCVNARDAMPTGGRIVISLRALEPGETAAPSPGPQVELVVSDSGPGMTPEVKARIFEPFYTTKTLGKGTGLGLAVAHGIVHQHGGTIAVESAPGQGTTFRVVLPQADPAKRPSVPAARQVAPPRTGQAKGTILLAEDDAQVRNLAIRYLEESGYQVIAAADGEEAEALFRKHEAVIRLAVLDVIMPKRNGRQVYDSIRQTHPELPVLFCSGYSANMLPAGLVPVSDMDLLSKPYSRDELLERVRRTLDLLG
jgi:signal transduction histidine kinase